MKSRFFKGSRTLTPYTVQTPQATPKQMTDEELRQQYGIQLASRPADSGDGKEAKWADIDDDEDDWAPDTIEWSDGTKINLSQVESSTPTREQLAVTADSKEVKQPENRDARSTAPKISSIGPKATVLKLGSSAQPKSPSFETPTPTSKAPGEKPTLVAKPSPAPPPKNPWAQLPPVDKIPLVTPPVQQLTSRFGQRESQSFEAMAPPSQPPPPAKEIAADDFSRLPRDLANGTPRELFNSQSGRYEPVPEGRRAAKRDQGFRTPSVLQRPSQSDVYGPAEPSPAFQTNRSQQDVSQWRRRRASSTISGEAGILGRRTSVSQAPKEAIQRRDSQLEQIQAAIDSSSRPSESATSPAVSHAQSIASQSSAVAHAPQVLPAQDLTAPGLQSPTTSVPPVGHTIEEVKMQKSLMKEKAEAAHKRRQDEEQRQEAERRERLRLKMEKLGLTDDRMGKRASEPEESAQSPKVVLEAAKKAKDDVPIEAQDPTKALSPPKPPVPIVNGEPQQYGLMKVHAPQVIAPLSPSAEKRPVVQVDASQDSRRDIRPSWPTEPAPQLNGDLVQKQTSPTPLSLASERDKLFDHLPQRLSPIPPAPNGHPAWGQHSMATHSTTGGNVWAAPANHKGLGNGDFQKRMQIPPTQSPFPPQHLVHPQPPPQPIGTPRQPQHSGPVLPESPIVSLPQKQSSHAAASESLAPSANQSRVHLPHVTPSLDQNLSTIPRVTMPQREPPKGGMAVWADFSNNPSSYDAKIREKLDQEHAALLAEHEKSGKPFSTGPILNETWKQVSKSDALGTRHVIGTVKTQRDFTTSEPALAPVAPRSRYQDIFNQNHQSYQNQLPMIRPGSPSPPPADIESHPVWVNPKRPVVNLPGSKVRSLDEIERINPKPIVKLPPPKSFNAAGITGLEPQPPLVGSLSPVRAMPFITNPTWQDRINGLFDRKAVLDRRSSDTDDFSFSKPSIDFLHFGATPVTLPSPTLLDKGTPQMPEKNPEDEEALFEERDFGSVPTVNVPAMAPPLAWNPIKPYVNKQRMKAMELSDTNVHSGLIFFPGYDDLKRQSGIPIVVKLVGMSAPKSKLLSYKTNIKPHRQPFTSLRGKPRYGNNKNREQPSPLSSASPAQLNTGRHSYQQQPGGQRKTSGNMNQSWARRVSGM